MKFGGKRFGSREKPEPEERPRSAARWLAADAPENPFGVRLLDLMVTQDIVAASTDPEIAARSVSWAGARLDEFDLSPALRVPHVDCTLEYSTAKSLPDG